MAVGNQNRQNNGVAYSAKLTLKEGDAFLDVPHFTFQAKQGTEYVDLSNEQIKETFGVDGPIRDIAGNLIAVDTRPGEYEGKPIHNVTLSLRDPSRNEVYFTQFVSNNNLGRNISNSILNLAAWTDKGEVISVVTENVQLGLWGQKNKEKKKTFPACSIRQGTSNDTVKWRFDPKTAPEMKPREYEGKGGVIEKDYTKVDAFLFAELGKLNEFLKANRGSQSQSTPKSAPQSPVASTPVADPTPAPSPETDPDGPPF